MAQLVEQRIRNAWVAGSSPAVGSIEFAGQPLMRMAFLLFLTRIASSEKWKYRWEYRKGAVLPLNK